MGKQTRKISKFIHLRNICDDVRAYLSNGIDNVTLKNWNEAYEFVKKI